MENKYKSCRYNGKRMRQHRAVILAVVQGWASMSEEEVRTYMAGIVVHHVNGDKDDNRRANLRVMSRGLHSRLHAKRQKRNAKGRFEK